MGLAGGESVWSDPSWLDEPSPETPWLANERYATVATRMEFQRSKRLFSRLARCLPACRKGMRSENPHASKQPRDSKATLGVDRALVALGLANSKNSFPLRF